MNTLNNRVVKAVFYVVAVAFHAVLFLTDIGNYFHGGTPIELIALNMLAVLIAAGAIKLLRKVGTVEKISVALCAVVPVITVVWALISLIQKR